MQLRFSQKGQCYKVEWHCHHHSSASLVLDIQEISLFILERELTVFKIHYLSVND